MRRRNARTALRNEDSRPQNSGECLRQIYDKTGRQGDHASVSACHLERISAGLRFWVGRFEQTPECGVCLVSIFTRHEADSRDQADFEENA